MADLSSLEQAVRARAAFLFADAVDNMQAKLQAAAPVGTSDPLGRPRRGPRLRDTFRRGTPERTTDTFRIMVGFTAPQATFSNDLMPSHFIAPRGQYPLRFYWDNGPNGPGVYHYMHVNHPGNINAESRGWWDRAATPETWSEALQGAQ